MVLIDLNVLLDVLQNRASGYKASAMLVDQTIRGELEATIAAHAITTLHYIIGKYQDRKTADQSTDTVLRHFQIAPVGKAELVRARGLNWNDFEDAVVFSAAESSGCETIVTRNIKDFKLSMIPAMTPEEFLTMNH